MASMLLEIEPKSLLVADLKELARQGRFRLEPELDPNQTIAGWLRLEVRANDSLAGSRLIAAATFSANDDDLLATVPLLAAGDTHTLFLHVAQSPQSGVFQGLAILNLSGRQNPVTVQAFDRSGGKRAEVHFVLDARNRITGLLNEERFFGPSFVQTGGHLRVLSDQPAASFSLFGGPAFFSTIEGQPALNHRAFAFLGGE